MIIINSKDELLKQLTENGLANECIAFQSKTQIIPPDILHLIKQLHAGFEDKHNPIKGEPFSFGQQQCVDLLLAGKNNKEIANHLNLSVRTVEKYITTVKTRMKVRSRLELALLLKSN